MKRELTCIICPNGCSLETETDDERKIVSVKGGLCCRGKEYAQQEMVDPQRTIATSVLLTGGKLPLVSVRLNRPVPKNRITDVMAEIRKVKVAAPTVTGTVIIRNILGFDADVIITKDVEAIK